MDDKDQLGAFGKYHLLDRVGKGGMAEVFVARPWGQKRLVAIKVMRDKLAKERLYLEMFKREGTLAVQLNHDAIVRSYEIGRVHGKHFICMEYISGVDLSHLLRACRSVPDRRLPVPHCLHIAVRLCEGLHYAHELKDADGASLNVVNRDVGPSNIRLSFDGDVKLLDFGIAKATSALSSEIGTLKGKISYMSPEQVRGLPLDRRADVFACGIVLHQMLTQEKLFKGDSEFQIMHQVRQAEVRPPSALNPRVPAEIDQIVLRALNKDPADRFQTAEQMAEQLRAVLVRYNFQHSELRDLVRDVCRTEWKQEQERLEGYLSIDDADAPQSPDDEEDYYGDILLDVEDRDEPPLRADPGPAAAPRWIWALLALAVVLLSTAVVLLLTLG